MNSHDMASAGGKSASSLGAGLAKLFMFVIATGLLLYGILSLLPARYEARAVLKFEGEGAQAALAEAMEAMRSRELISSFAREQQLARHADFNPAPGRQGPVDELFMLFGLRPDFARMPAKQRLLAAFRENLVISAIPEKRLLNIGFRTSDPSFSARLANDYARMLASLGGGNGTAENNLQASEAGAENVKVAALRSALAKAGKRNQIRIRTLEILQRQAGTAVALAGGGPGFAENVQGGQAGKTGSDIERQKEIDELNRQLVIERSQRLELEKIAGQMPDLLKSGKGPNLDGITSNGRQIESLLRRRHKMRQRMKQTEARLLPAHPRYKRQRRQLAMLEKKLADEGKIASQELAGKIRAGLEQEKKLEEKIEVLHGWKQPAQADAMSMSGSGMGRPVDGRAKSASQTGGGQMLGDGIASLRAEIEGGYEEIKSLRLELASARREAALRPSLPAGDRLRVVVVKRAVANPDPVFPRKRQISIMGMLAALILGSISLLAGALLPSRQPQGHGRQSAAKAAAAPVSAAMPGN